MLKVENQINLLLEHIVETSSAATARAYERKIEQMEKDKLVMADTLENSFKPKATSGQMLELSLRFLSNPWKLWASGNIDLQKMVLRLAFLEPLPYCWNEGYRTVKTTLPFNVLGDFCTSKCKMVPRGGIEPPTRGFSVRCSTN